MPYKNKEKQKKCIEEWCKNNPEYHKKFYKIWSKNNHIKIRIRYNHWYNKRIKTDLKFNLNRKIKVMMGHSLKGNKNGRHWEILVGYTLSDLIKRLNRTIPKGYTWQDYLEGKLHIDHRIPINAHNYTKSEHPDFKRCWALSNLQLLPAKENRIKHNKLYKPFQPALKLNVEVIS